MPKGATVKHSNSARGYVLCSRLFAVDDENSSINFVISETGRPFSVSVATTSPRIDMTLDDMLIVAHEAICASVVIRKLQTLGVYAPADQKNDVEKVDDDSSPE